MTVIHWPMDPPAIVESVEARDRRDCITLDKKATGANRELAQWLLDHPTYTNRTIAEWLGTPNSHSRIGYLRRWAKSGFVGLPFDNNARRDTRTRHDGLAAAQEALKTQDNFQDDTTEWDEDAVEDPAVVVKNVLVSIKDSIADAKAVAEAYRKIFKLSSFDSEQKAEIYNAINLLIVKWRTVQSTLDRKGQRHGESQDN